MNEKNQSQRFVNPRSGQRARAVFDRHLIRKYNVPGPRYTSYPTAPHFTEAIDPAILLKDLHDGPPGRDLSLYIHLPFCETLCWFCGCTKVITRDRSSADRYLDYLEREIRLTAPLIHPGREVVQVHFGGGTPTFLTPEQLGRLGSMLYEAFRFHPNCEFGVEIDPRRLSLEHIQALRAIGCNRASLGVQDNNAKVQEAINRIQPFELTAQAIEWLRGERFQSINIDLIYGLPLQTVDSFAKTIDEVVQLRPERFAIFSYAHVPWIKPAQRIFDTKRVLPDDETKLSILELTVERLTGRGYTYIGMDHFALETDELARAQRTGTLQRNFQGYSTKSGADICALGMSSISQTPDSYRQNAKELPAYYAALDDGRIPAAKGYRLTEDDKIRRSTIMRLMCDGRLLFEPLSRELGILFPEYFAKEIERLEPLKEDGLVDLAAGAVTVTPAGRFLLRNIAMIFDAFIQEGGTRRFSRTV